MHLMLCFASPCSNLNLWSVQSSQSLCRACFVWADLHSQDGTHSSRLRNHREKRYICTQWSKLEGSGCPVISSHLSSSLFGAPTIFKQYEVLGMPGSKRCDSGVPLWSSRLRIRCYHCSGSGPWRVQSLAQAFHMLQAQPKQTKNKKQDMMLLPRSPPSRGGDFPSWKALNPLLQCCTQIPWGSFPF